MSISSRRPRRFMGAVVAGMALLLVPAGFTAAQAAPTVAPVTGLKIVTAPPSPSGELSIVWNASTSPDVIGYSVDVQDQPFGGSYNDFVPAGDPLTYTAEGLSPSQPVRFTVSAIAATEEDGEFASASRSVIGNTLGDVNEDGTFFDTIGNTFEYEIAWLATSGITTGYPDGNFRPSAPVLREQMAAFLFRLSGFSEYEAPDESLFTDVATTDTFYREISWLAEEGISTGYANGDGTRSFAPSQPVLREQMAAFLYRAFGFDYSHGFDPASFADTPRSSTFFNEIEFLALVNITTGYKEANGTLTFRGSQPVLREQMAAFLYRTVGVVYQLDFFPSGEFTIAPDAPIEPTS
ncbi:S-layer homology domain-containing protein [Aeromicrobium sp. Sec7.5]|uniref:S-layer homology domain-containing protein n=1 Tax=Aeromicrobium sp. Sec7.5 TaxID=3121276 RepID=UPI002FE47671